MAQCVCQPVRDTVSFGSVATFCNRTNQKRKKLVTKNKQTNHQEQQQPFGEWLITGAPTRFSTEQVFEYAKSEMARAKHEGYEAVVGIGTDSQMIGRQFRFITVLCVYRQGRGGFYFYTPQSVQRDKYVKKNQKQRMFDEVGKSIELALALQENTGILSDIHIDASPNNRAEFTSAFSDQLAGYVRGCGFNCIMKPESYVSSGLADSHSKAKSARKDRRRHRQHLASVTPH